MIFRLSPRRARRAGALLIAALMAVPPAPSLAEGLAGPYLAARHATQASDYRAAATHYTEALVRDPSNPVLLENAIVSQVGVGALDRAIPIARRFQQTGVNSQFANIVMLADQLKRGDYEALAADQAAGRRTAPIVDGLVAAWAEFGAGRMSEALAAFDAVAEAPGQAPFGLYHKALALASAGDFEGADALLAGRDGAPLPLTRRGVIAHIQVLSQLERFADAIAVLDTAFANGGDPAITALRAQLEAGAPLPFDIVTSAAEGQAEVFLTVAIALSGDAAEGYTLVYARIAEYLRPDLADAVLMTADLLREQRQYDLASETYNRIPRNDPAFFSAEMGRADSLYLAGKTEAAVEVMEQLAKSHADVPVVQTALGDMLRREERFAEAAAAYDAAIALLGAPEPSHWVVYYTRGISLERQQKMDLAEADLRMALQLNPDQPQVLNYLGYSFIEANRNLEEALGMIERAVAARPDDGYIIDSLAWAFYRLGRFDAAVEPMERAAELEAVDPVVNDHLGDVYWSVGRKLEAQFQWRRALSFDPEAKEAVRIRRKLEVGLDVVLQEEGATPPAVTADGN